MSVVLFIEHIITLRQGNCVFSGVNLSVRLLAVLISYPDAVGVTTPSHELLGFTC